MRVNILLWLAYLLFVVYGSLVPLQYRPLPLEQAVREFFSIKLLQVGLQGRADWIANGVLYLPLGFLTAGALTGRGRSRPGLPAQALAIVLTLGLALAVEFVQLFFPPRTVSLNDLIAESIGSVAGVALAAFVLPRYRQVLETIRQAAPNLYATLLGSYVLAFLGLSLFPYDFLLSAGELQAKIASDNWGLVLAPSVTAGGFAALVKTVAEVLSVVPLGLWLAQRGGSGVARAAALGALVGALIEAAQFFIGSGVTQGASVPTRAAGVALGVAVGRALEHHGAPALVEIARRYRYPALAVYLLALAVANGLFSGRIPDPGAVRETLAGLDYLPFYYHYFTTEQAALFSLLAVAGMYLPLGVFGWLSGWRGAVVAGGGALLALAVEAGKLLLAGRRPDPTDVLIGAAAAFAMWRLLELLRASQLPGKADQGGPLPVPAAGTGVPVGRLLAGVAGAVLVWTCASYPVLPGLLALALAGTGVALAMRPQWAAVLVPACLPVLDFTGWTGRLRWDEFDALLLLTSTVVLLRVPAPAQPRRSVGVGALALVALAIGVGHAVLASGLGDPTVQGGYYSGWNALRIVRGVLWGLLFVSLLRRLAGAGHDVHRLVSTGLTAGLAMVVLVVLWERLAFPGLGNFEDVYRVTGPFSQMHVGGSDLELFLVVACAWPLVDLVQDRAPLGRALRGVLLLATGYAVLVTFSRAAYAAFALQLLLLPLLALRLGAERRRNLLVAGGLLAGAALIAVPVLSGAMARERLAAIPADLGVRLAHWGDALDILERGGATRLFGAGLGRYPELHYWQSAERHSATFGLAGDGERRVLRLGAGSPLYVEQFIGARADEPVLVELRLRRPAASAAVLEVAVCEKWLLTSARCATERFAPTADGGWRDFKAMLRFDAATGAVRWPRPLKLSLYLAGGDGLLEVESVSAIDTSGSELLDNGNFARGLDHWFFAVDSDLPWHIWNLPLALLFDLGWFGALAVGAWLAHALLSAARAVATTPRVAAVPAALLGILVVGCANSVIDSPRMLLLVITVAGLATLGRAEPQRAGHGSRSRSRRTASDRKPGRIEAGAPPAPQAECR